MILVPHGAAAGGDAGHAANAAMACADDVRTVYFAAALTRRGET